MRKISDDFEQTYLIPGNHEYYGGFDVQSALVKTNEKLLDNVTMINNDVVNYEGVRFIFSTFWSNICLYVLEVTRGLMDFHRIRYNGKLLN